MWACQSNFVEIVEMLLHAGAAVNALNTAGRTPLIYAAGSVNGAEITERGADPNVHGPITTPLILACGRSSPKFGGFGVCDMVISVGANVNAKKPRR
jgi:ankyrin repeat protein